MTEGDYKPRFRTNEANMARLADYLEALPDDYVDFDMSNYREGEGRGAIARVVCGTAGCAVGHGPNAGIKPLRGETWYEYSQRAFTGDDYAWQWCFSGAWSYRDNTPKGAAARIRWFLKNGVPDDSYEQRTGEASLCYVENFE